LVAAFGPLRWLAGLAFLLLLCWFLFFYRLADRDLASSHEARAAQNAQSIVRDGTWGLPRLLNGRIELQKPPLYYWLVAIFAHLRGGVVDAFAVRMPSALSALGCVLLVFCWGWRRGRLRAGFCAAVILATCVHFTWLARVGRIDMPLTLTTSLSLFGFYSASLCREEQSEKKAWLWFLLAYVAVAAGVMLKGPIAIVLPAVVAAVSALSAKYAVRSPQHSGPQHSVLRTPYSPWRRSTLWWGIPFVITIAAPWYIWANIETHNQLVRVFFWHHNVERGLGGSDTLVARPWWFYGPRLFLDLLPWSLLFPLAVWQLCKRWRSDRAGRFGLVWLLSVVGILSLMRFKRADYLLPAYPGAALWLGCVLERWFAAQTQSSFSPEPTARAAATHRYRRLPAKRPGWLLYLLGSIVAGYVACWAFYLEVIEPRQERHHSYSRFAAEIRRRTRDQVIFFRTEAHELVFHVGRPLDTILEWENLDVWASQPAIYVVMPPDCARDWPRFLRKGRLEEVLRTTDLATDGERPLVLFRSAVGPAK
jgi:4-amino-4-deoxy-L-arabinose transferase-like glycosyltransferase